MVVIVITLNEQSLAVGSARLVEESEVVFTNGMVGYVSAPDEAVEVTVVKFGLSVLLVL